MKLNKSNKSKEYTYPNSVTLVKSGSDYFGRMGDMIDNAKHVIHLHVYILENDETGENIINKLCVAVTRKVKVYLLVDGYASQALGKEFSLRMKRAGVEFKFFNPVLKSKNFYFGRRLHQKVFVVDDFYSMVGGINITDRYNDMPEQKAWLDFALYSEGPISTRLAINCWKTWTGFLKSPKQYSPLHSKIEPQSDFNNVKVKMAVNDWVKAQVQISGSYVSLLSQSREKVILLSSYFMPGTAIRKNIKKAIKRGVKIKIIITGKSDVGISKRAERYMYDWLLRNKIEIYEYQNAVLHGKIAVGDKTLVTVGSYNVNDISAFASVELNLDVSDNDFGAYVDKVLETVIKSDCVNITDEIVSKQKNIFHQFSLWVSYYAVRLLIILFTFYMKQEEK